MKARAAIGVWRMLVGGLVDSRRRETFLLNMKMLREWDEEGDEGNTGGYLCCVSFHAIYSAAAGSMQLGGALSARVSGEKGPRMTWGFSYLGAAELFAFKPR